MGWGHCVLFDELGGEKERLGGLDRVETGEARVSVVRDMQGEFHVQSERDGLMLMGWDRIESSVEGDFHQVEQGTSLECIHTYIRGI